MDRLIYVAMTGAKQILLAQAANTHNLANASTTGFRADLHAFASVPVRGPGHATRINAVAEGAGWDPSGGSLERTGRALDIAVQGRGFLAVQAPGGEEGYTRAGDLRVGTGGILTNGAGHPVLGESGPVAVPPFEELVIGEDGTVSIVPLGQSAQTLALVDRLKLVDPPAESIAKGDDGLMRLREGGTAEADAGVRLASGALESSNVNVVREMVGMIELARQWDMQIKMMRSAEDNAGTAARLLRLG